MKNKKKQYREEDLDFQDYGPEDAEKAEAEMSSSTGYAKIAQGKNTLRILPGVSGEPWYSVSYKHFVDTPAGRKSFECPKMHTKGKRKCKTCARVKKLQDSPDPVDQSKANSLSFQKKTRVNAVNRKDEDAGPRTYDLSPGVGKDLSNIMKTDINFTHPLKGCDVNIVRTGEGRNKTRYSVSADRKVTPLHESKSVMKEWIENAPSLKVKLLSDDEIDALLRGEDVYQNRRKRSDDDDSDSGMDDDDFSARDEEDEEEEAPPKKKRRPVDEDGDLPKKKKRRPVDDEDEEIDI